jgi:alkanesulfonate monooxygenase SsuD/methylene tetrahydromethanopterin reductase-like flavin-dependent oxidoreductase (luciferase family)
MKFGLFYELSVPRPWTRESERTVYMNALEQVRLADEIGFDQVWAVEHHFLEEYSHCPAPELFLTACAMTTKKIRVGHGLRRPPRGRHRAIRHLDGARRLPGQS